MHAVVSDIACSGARLHPNHVVLQFAWKIFRNGSAITVTLGRPIDVLGNYVDEDGKSIDKAGKSIDVSAYFRREGEVVVEEPGVIGNVPDLLAESKIIVRKAEKPIE